MRLSNVPEYLPAAHSEHCFSLVLASLPSMARKVPGLHSTHELLPAVSE